MDSHEIRCRSFMILRGYSSSRAASRRNLYLIQWKVYCFLKILFLVASCPTCFRCLHAPAHLIQTINSSFIKLCRSLVTAHSFESGVPEQEKHLNHKNVFVFGDATRRASWKRTKPPSSKLWSQLDLVTKLDNCNIHMMHKGPKNTFSHNFTSWKNWLEKKQQKKHFWSVTTPLK